MILGGIAFSIVNAAVEEGAYRGILFQALRATGIGPYYLLSIQAAAFGVLHLNGFPRGAAGIVLAAVYGLMMGFIRLKAGGMLAPWIAHVLADLTIVSIILLLAA